MFDNVHGVHPLQEYVCAPDVEEVVVRNWAPYINPNVLPLKLGDEMFLNRSQMRRLFPHARTVRHIEEPSINQGKHFSLKCGILLKLFSVGDHLQTLESDVFKSLKTVPAPIFFFKYWQWSHIACIQKTQKG